MFLSDLIDKLDKQKAKIIETHDQKSVQEIKNWLFENYNLPKDFEDFKIFKCTSYFRDLGELFLSNNDSTWPEFYTIGTKGLTYRGYQNNHWYVNGKLDKEIKSLNLEEEEPEELEKIIKIADQLDQLKKYLFPSEENEQ